MMVLSNLTNKPTTSSVTSRCSYFTVSQCDTLIKIKIVAAVISMVVTIIAVALALLLNKYKILAQRIVLMIIVTDWLANLCNLLHDGGTDNSISCIAVGYFSEVFDLMTIFAFIALTIFILLRIRFNKDTARYQWLYAAMIIVSAVIIAFIPIEVYGPAGAWCWIVATDKGHIYRMMLYWFPMLISSVCLAVIFIYLYIYSRRLILRYNDRDPRSRAVQKNQEILLNQYLKPYVGIGIAYLLLQIIMFVNRLNDWVSGSGNYGLHIVHTIGATIIGVIYSALLFTTNTWAEFKLSNIIGGVDRLKKDISSYSCRRDGCCCNQNSDDGAIETSLHPGDPTMGTSANSTLRREPENPTLPTITAGGSSTNSTCYSPESSNSNQASVHLRCPSGVTEDASESGKINYAFDSITLSDVEDCSTSHSFARGNKTSNSEKPV